MDLLLVIVISYFPYCISINTDMDNRDKTIEKLQKKVQFFEQQLVGVQKLFTEKQLKKLSNPEKVARWNITDISKAIVLYAAGPRSYRLMLRQGFPFPATSTLSWLKKIRIEPGILKKVFNIIKLIPTAENDRVCVLSFDEIKIRNCYCYDKANDETLNPRSYAQVVMIRGLFSNWKQPIYYAYDCKMTKEILFEIIKYTEEAGNIKFLLTRMNCIFLMILFKVFQLLLS